jgi:DNA polymerase/3'-5' exonuclease PolX
MDLTTARNLATALATDMAPCCVSVEVAGSVRRGRPDVKDLEIVAVPRWIDTAGADLFGTPEPRNTLHAWALNAERQGRLQWIKPGTSEVIAWAPKPEGRYWRGLLRPEGVKLDLFLATPANAGLVLAIRTGSADFSRALVTYARRIGWYVDDGRLWNAADKCVPTPDERSVFAALGLAWVPPEEREDGSGLRLARAPGGDD